MRTRIFVLFNSLTFPIMSNSQDLDVKLFNDICNQIIKQNQYYKLSKELLGIKILADPIKNKSIILYDSCKNKTAIQALKKYSFKEQLSIVRNEFIPILLLTDTIIVFDSIGFFVNDISYKKDFYFFKLCKRQVNEDINNNKNTLVYLMAIAVKKNKLMAALGFENKTKILDLYYSMGLNKNYSDFKLVNIRVLPAH